MIRERIEKLRKLMAEKGIAVYIVPTSDFHESEYVGEYFKARQFITGFTGSAGTAVITMEEANLWTDARYFLQAESQLQGSGIILRKMGEDNVPTIDAYIKSILKEGENIGFDGRVINQTDGKLFASIAKDKGGDVLWDEDLIERIWIDRPSLSAEPLFILDMAYSGEDVSSKLNKIRNSIDKKQADLHLISSLYDIAWILNLRGNDINYVPVFLSYMAISKENCILFIQDKQLTDDIGQYLSSFGIETRSYETFYEYVSSINANTRVLLDERIISYRTMQSLPSTVEIINSPNPSTLMKAIRNSVQIDNIRDAHLKDAVAMCKFMYWLKTNIGTIPMSELSASDYLEGLRREQEGFIELSFETISGYNAHGAIVHYAVTPETDIPLAANGLLLVDSGAHYLTGTTDITRTFALGEISDEMRADFTRVCRSNMNLANARFLKGCSGLNLDVIARMPFWEVGKDFKHGTGHGVGFILNVHEGPNAFRWRMSPGRSECTPLEEGMVTTDEPGIYIEGQYGIRTENELLCRQGEKNEYGQFMYFENLTYVPIDLDAIDASQMSETEKMYLNDYHRMVYEKVSPLLEGAELEFLKKYTRAI